LYAYFSNDKQCRRAGAATSRRLISQCDVLKNEATKLLKAGVDCNDFLAAVCGMWYNSQVSMTTRSTLQVGGQPRLFCDGVAA